jgi:hypothetical protein
MTMQNPRPRVIGPEPEGDITRVYCYYVSARRVDVVGCGLACGFDNVESVL